MGREGLEDQPGIEPDEIPEERCGYTTNYRDQPERPGDVTCWRESWDASDDGRCIWHADIEEKRIDELPDTDSDGRERFDGAILRGAELGDTGVLANKVLQGADLSGAFLRGADLNGAVLRGADLSGGDFLGSDFSGADLGDTDFREANLMSVDFTEAYLRDADLTDAELQGATFTDTVLWGADLTDADLGSADLTATALVGADLTNADLRMASFTDVDLREADLTGAAIMCTELENFEFNDGTMFGGRSRLEADADAAARVTPYLPGSVDPLRCLGRPSTGSTPLKHAELQYRGTQRILRENDFQQLPELTLREKHARRKRALAERDYWTWFKLATYRWPLGYGEQPWKVIGTAIAVIVGCALLFPLLGGTEPPPDSIWDQLYFSVVTFTTLGFGDFKPATEAARTLAGFEAFVGSLLMAFLVFVLGRRVTW